MTEPQSGIIPEPEANGLFLILRAQPARAKTLGRALADVPALMAKVAALDPKAKLVGTIAIGPDLWKTLSPNARPYGLRPFKAIQNGGLMAPATGGDVLLHLVSKRHDLNVELAMRFRRTLGDAVVVLDEVHGFRYLDGRDLTGFIEGTENPKGKERAAVALIGKEDRDFAGGSYVFAQRYVHDLAAWNPLSEKDQESIIGRRKRDSKELSDKAKPPTAHIARTVIEENGAELEIVRHSFPYGTVSEAGLFFVAYTKDLAIPEFMLRRMLGVEADGVHDRLMDFSRAVSGATFFAPSLSSLRALGK